MSVIFYIDYNFVSKFLVFYVFFFFLIVEQKHKAIKSLFVIKKKNVTAMHGNFLWSMTLRD